jgi:regulator of replication initiation timing
MRSALLDENEQLRTSLETALEENAALIEDRDRLLRRVAELARDFRYAQRICALREAESG